LAAEQRRGPGLRLWLAALVCLVVGALGGVLAAVVTSRPPEAAASFTPPLEPPPDFRLRDQEGRWQRPSDHRGKVLVITFLYSTCPDLCPKQATEVGEAVGKLGGKGVHVLGVSVDPAGDNASRAKGFLQRNGLEGGPVSYLLGTRAQLAPVWAAYGIVPVQADDKAAAETALLSERYYREEAREEARAKARGIELEEEEYEPTPEQIREAEEIPPDVEDPYPAPDDRVYRGRRRHYKLDFEHSAYVMLIDKHGRQRVGFPFEQLDADLLARDMRMLLAEP
jgi:protein SCO1